MDDDSATTSSSGNDISELRRRYENGASLNQLARETSRTRYKVKQLLDEAGATIRTRSRRDPERDKAAAEKLRQEYEADPKMTVAMLMVSSGRTPQEVKYLLKLAGTKMRRGFQPKLPRGEDRKNLASDLKRRYDNGATERDLAHDLGVGRTVVARLLREAGTVKRPAGKPPTRRPAPIPHKRAERSGSQLSNPSAENTARVHVMQQTHEPDEAHRAHLHLATQITEDTPTLRLDQVRQLAAQARACQAHECPDPDVRDSVHRMLRLLFVSGDHQTCQAYVAEVARTWTSRFGPNDLMTLRAARLLGHVLEKLGHLDRARELQSRNLTLLQAHPDAGAAHPDTLATMAALANVARSSGLFREALETNEEQFTLARHHHGDETPVTLGAANDLAVSHRFLGQHRQAREILAGAMKVTARVLGPNDGLTLLMSTNLAVEVGALGDYRQADAMLEDTHRRMLQVVPENATIAITTLAALAVTRRLTGATEAAIDLGHQALDLYRAAGSPQPHLPSVGVTLCLAQSYRQAGQLGRAADLGQQAHDDLRRVLPTRHPAVLAAAADWAATLRHSDPHQAAQIAGDTLPTLVEVLGPKHPVTLVCAITTASAHYQLGRYERARSLDAATFTFCRRTLGAGHPITLVCRLHLAADIAQVGDTATAEQLREQALTCLQQTLGDAHPTVREVMPATGRADCNIPPMHT